MKQVNVILTLERLPIHWPGAYGNTTRDTVGLDRLTLNSTVFNRVYATCCDAEETLLQLADSRLAQAFAGTKTFFTDCEELAVPEWFDEAEGLDAAAFFSAELEMAPEELLWCHFQQWNLAELNDWLARYTPLAVLSVSGMPALVEEPLVEDEDEEGEENDGVAESLEDCELELPELPMLHHTEIQLPWWIRFPDETWAATRFNGLVTPADFATMWLAGTPCAVQREEVRVQDFPRWACVTDEWFLTCLETAENGETTAELYSKPDDWWEQNNVASLYTDLIEEWTQNRKP